MKFYLPIILLLISSASFSLQAQTNKSSSQTAVQLNNAFTSYAQLYNIPVDVLKSVAFAETRMTQIIPVGFTVITFPDCETRQSWGGEPSII